MSKFFVAMIAQVLGIHSGFLVDTTVLGFLVALSHTRENSFIRFYFCQFLSDAIHKQFPDFGGTRSFRYQSYLVHLFIHQNYYHLGDLQPRMVNENHVALLAPNGKKANQAPNGKKASHK